MDRRSINRVISSFVAVVFVVAGPAAWAPDDELPANQDNGAQGRNPFDDPEHVPPIKACGDRERPSNSSLVIRRLPRGPLAPDGSLAFQSGACVYLPPGYVRSGLRYPVLYLLHGGGGDQAAWVSYGGIQSMMDGLIKADRRKALIIVMPDGRDAQWYDSYDRTILNERYVLDYLMPYVDRHFRTIPDRRGRAIAGLSNGGYGALHYAAKAPDRFVAAGSMSGNVGGRSFGGLGTPIVPGVIQAQEAGTYYYGNVPIELASNLDYLDLVINWGASCSSDLETDLCAAWAFEQSFRMDNRDFRDRLDAVEHRGGLTYSEDEGGHAWRWWPKWLLEKHLPVFYSRLDDPLPAGSRVRPARPPFPFRYRSIARSFSIYGYEVQIERGASEFFDLVDVTRSGFNVQGSGVANVKTAPIYRPGRRYVVSGTGRSSRTLQADRDGRLDIFIDLLPAHPYEQYEVRGRALEAAGNYWTVRTVTIR
ncbi:MAG: alpha/beta hydrolase [Actinomycetota bacterium]